MTPGSGHCARTKPGAVTTSWRRGPPHFATPRRTHAATTSRGGVCTSWRDASRAPAVRTPRTPPGTRLLRSPHPHAARPTRHAPPALAPSARRASCPPRSSCVRPVRTPRVLPGPRLLHSHRPHAARPTRPAPPALRSLPSHSATCPGRLCRPLQAVLNADRGPRAAARGLCCRLQTVPPDARRPTPDARGPTPDPRRWPHVAPYAATRRRSRPRITTTTATIAASASPTITGAPTSTALSSPPRVACAPSHRAVAPCTR